MNSPSLALLLLLPVTWPIVAFSATPARGSWQTVDLKSFFHGEPPPFVKAPPPPVTAAVSFAPGIAPDKDIAAFLTAFALALKAREGVQMIPRLSDQYTTADLPAGRKASEFFAQAVDKMPGPTEIVVLAVETKAGVRWAKLEFRYPGRGSPKLFKFDAGGKLLGSDLFSLKRVHGGE